MFTKQACLVTSHIYPVNALQWFKNTATPASHLLYASNNIPPTVQKQNTLTNSNKKKKRNNGEEGKEKGPLLPIRNQKLLTPFPPHSQLRLERHLNPSILRNNAHNDGNIVMFASMPILTGIILLHLPGKRAVALHVQAGLLGGLCDGIREFRRQAHEGLDGVGIALWRAQRAGVDTALACRVRRDPVLPLLHHAADYRERVHGAEVVPHAVRRKDQHVAVFHLVRLHVCVLGRLGDDAAFAKDCVLGAHARRQLGQLVRGVEGVGLGVGLVGDPLGAQEDVP